MNYLFIRIFLKIEKVECQEMFNLSSSYNLFISQIFNYYPMQDFTNTILVHLYCTFMIR